MIALLIGSVFLSLLHAVIPNHWLPILAIAKKEKWTDAETIQVTFLAASAHVVSTVAIGVVLAKLGLVLSHSIEAFTHWVAPLILVLMGLFFIWQHYQHNHFHIHAKELEGMKPKRQLVFSLALMMFLSPCMEVEAYFLAAGKIGWWAVGLIALIYAFVTINGMVLWMRIALKGLKNRDWHQIEHNAGLVMGGILIATGILLYFFPL